MRAPRAGDPHDDTVRQTRVARHRTDSKGPSDGQDRPSIAEWPASARQLIELQRAVGNRAVGAALMPLQRAPGDKVPVKDKKSPSKDEGADLKLPWAWGDWTAFELTSSGIRFLAAVGKQQESAVKAAVSKLAPRIVADNAVIADSARKVMTCFITPGTTRFAYWGTKAVLLLDPADADVPTVAHEMGHAVLDALMQAGASAGKGGSAGGGADPKAKAPATVTVPARVADLYLRLQDTKTAKDSSASVGLLMVDPSEWSPGAKSEHPWQDADEFFASAKAAYHVNRKGLEASIARATKVDKAVGPLAKELLALLDAVFGKAKMPTAVLPADRSSAAAAELGRVKSASQIMDSVALYPQLGWLVDPKTRPGRR